MSRNEDVEDGLGHEGLAPSAEERRQEREEERRQERQRERALEDQPAPPTIGKGCEHCGNFPVELFQKCHPGAPLRAVVPREGLLELRCFVCAHIVVTMEISPIRTQ